MILNSLKQTETPLNTLYFSEYNQALVNRAIRQKYYDETGIRIDYQDERDLLAIMRQVFINNSGDHFGPDIYAQIRDMNTIVIDTCVAQINTGVATQMAYLRDISGLATPLDRPKNTSTTGNKLPVNNQIGV